MKKFLALLLIILLFLPNLAFAEDALQVVDSNIFIVGKNYGLYFAKVENKSDKPVLYEDGVLDMLDEKGNIVSSDKYIMPRQYHGIINPGEYAYIKTTLSGDSANVNLKTQLNIKSRESKNEYAVFESETTFKYASPYGNNYIYATFTNTSDKTLYGIGCSAALYDADGKIIFCDDKWILEIGVHPNTSTTVRFDIHSSLLDYFKENNIVPVKADAVIRYAIKDDNIIY
ncbi:MAG: hypothetical protein GYA87_07660 [Christensenellaceae bacterium]|nr:hypothetical protein [Christensenellaceae bacterium]